MSNLKPARRSLSTNSIPRAEAGVSTPLGCSPERTTHTLVSKHVEQSSCLRELLQEHGHDLTASVSAAVLHSQGESAIPAISISCRVQQHLQHVATAKAWLGYTHETEYAQKRLACEDGWHRCLLLEGQTYELGLLSLLS